MGIQVDNLNGELVFSDDRALLAPGWKDNIQQWLSERKPYPYVRFPEPVKIDYSLETPPTEITLHVVTFQFRHWQMDNCRRMFRAAVCVEREMEVLGPEINPISGNVIRESPVVEVVVKESEQPPASVQFWAQASARIWAALTDEEREQHPKIGEMAAMADLSEVVDA